MTDSSERTCRTGELFVCFSSRLSSYSSSMKLSSKSILSPARAARDVPISLSTSLSRRLRTNRSLRGAQSPMFPSSGKKRGCAFENPEPSSPKVTCIGQVRVKTKKQGKKMRTLSRRRGAAGEVSFRRVEQGHSNEEGLRQRNQRWVHLPVTICEALREFSCLFPCKSSCFSAKEDKATSSREESTGQNSCGASFVRWLVALHDGDGGKGREVELVLGEEEEATEAKDRTFRRHAVEAIEIRDEDFGGKKGDEEEARLSVCVPPKNALLLMRCRSDPMKMSALANRLWEYQAHTGEEEEEEKETEEGDSRLMDDKGIEMSEELVSAEANDEEENTEAEVEQNENLTAQETLGQENPEELVINDEPQEGEENGEPDQLHEPARDLAAEDNELNVSCEPFVDPETSENEGEEEDSEEEEEETEDDKRRSSHYSSTEVLSVHSLSAESEELAEEATLEEGEAEDAISEEDGTEAKSTEEKETQQSPPKEKIVTQEKDESEQTQTEDAESKEREQETHPTLERVSEEGEERESSSALPECLLLMKCEPKLSMEVSKETWVCSKDFISWRRRVSKRDGRDEPKKRLSTDSNAAAAQLPPRLSCSAVTGVSVATMLEQKKLGVGGFEPFVLTRCKSEPMRTAAAKLAPEGCFWKNRHRGAVGAAGVGF